MIVLKRPVIASSSGETLYLALKRRGVSLRASSLRLPDRDVLYVTIRSTLPDPQHLPIRESGLPWCVLQCSLLIRNNPPVGPYISICLWSYDGPRGVGVSYDQGTLVQ